ncbi:MAG: ABC transporter ATP-binding protein [Chloroflexi bacterium]|nr:ABC transporter ATP-binding protein [Chloroflexota bacterium]
MATLVEVKSLVKRYSGSAQPAVRGVSFSIEQGEIFGLLGPNGAGKTTTISMLAGLTEPTDGTATIAGFDVVRQPGEAKRRSGLVPQEIALYPRLSARDNVAFFGRVYGLRGAELRRRVDAALEMVGLSGRADDPVEKLSGGMKRRVNVAAGLLHSPAILFLDEPTVGVDPQSRNFIFEHVEALNRDGLTVLYTTHYMEEAQRLCHRVAIVDQGQIIALDTPKGLIDSLGGGVIVLGVPDGTPETVDHGLRGLPGVLDVGRSDHQIKVKAQQVQRALIGVLEALSQADVSIQSLEILEPNLESVFLALTGKRLRD